MTDEHHPWSQWLMAWHDGELSAHHRERMQEHLTSCSRCQRLLAELHHLSQLLQEATVPWQSICPPERAWQRMATRLGRRRPPAANAPRWVHWLPPTGLLMVNTVIQFLGTAILVLTVLSALGLIEAQRLRETSISSDPMLSWLLLRTVAEPLGWGAGLLSTAPQWRPALDFLLSFLLFETLGLTLGIGYMASLWLLWRRTR